MKHTRGLVLLLVITAGLSARVLGDEVILKDGRTFTGEITKETDESVSIRTVGGVLTFPRSQVVRVAWKADPRKIYNQRADALNAKTANARMELARWCKAQGLEAEARRELEHVLLLDPQNTDAQTMLGDVAKSFGSDIPVRAEVILSDGSQVKGKLINALFTLETDYGILHISTKTVTLVEMSDGKSPDVIQTPGFRAKGRLGEELFVVDSQLGRLSIAKKDIRDFTLYRPTAEELVEIEFNSTMRDYNHFGLDVMVVVDCTDSMAGVLLRLRQQADKLCQAVRKFVPNSRFGVVSYRDHKEFDPAEFTYVTQLYPLTDKVEEFRDALNGLRAKGGGDIPEAVYDGLAESMTKGGWRPTSHRIIILIGDAPPHAENNGLKKTLTLVNDWCQNTQGTVHVIDTTGYDRLMDEYVQIAKAGGGKAVILNDETKIGRELVPLILGSEWSERFLRVYDELTTPAPAPPAGAEGPPAAGVIGG